MNMTSVKSSQVANDYVVVFLVIPGLNNVAVGCAMLIARLLQETIERANAWNAALLAESVSFQSTTAAMHDYADGDLNRIDHISCASRSESIDTDIASRNFTGDVVERLYGAAPLSFVRHVDQIYFAFPVSDVEAGLSAVEAEVKRIGFSELAEISHYSVHSKNSNAGLALHCADVLKRAGLLPE
jgi:hypothetical protein